MSRVPVLSGSLAYELETALESSKDGWVRAVLPSDWPLEEGLKEVFKKWDKLRLGLLDPFSADLGEKVGCTYKTSGHDITKWRNASVAKRRAAPAIILGDASGPEEAGLVSAPVVVSEDAVLDHWFAELKRWTKAFAQQIEIQSLIDVLISAVRTGHVNATSADEYLTKSLGKTDGTADKLRRNLWILELIPDVRLLDTGKTRERIRANLSVKELLQSATDSATDAARLANLERAAERGDGVAAKLLSFRDSGDAKDLKDINLDAVLAILDPFRPPPPPGVPDCDLFEFLDHVAGLEEEVIAKFLRPIADSWDISDPQPQVMQYGFAHTSKESREVRVKVEPSSAELWAGKSEEGDQVVSVIAPATHLKRDWDPKIEGQKILGNDLLAVAKAQDAFIGEPRFEPLVNAYLEARKAFGTYESWLRHCALALFILKEEARKAARNFVNAWTALVDVAAQTSKEDAELIREQLLLLECLWGRDETAGRHTWAVPSDLHPYAIQPSLQIAEYVLASLGADRLGDKATWAFDRAVPAFQSMWSPNSTLFLARSSETFVYAERVEASQPRTSGSGGLVEIVRAFLGYHPFAEGGLVMLLVDPPMGGGVSSDLRRIRALLKDKLAVYLITTSPDASQLEECSDFVRYLGRYKSPEEWLAKNSMRVHIAVQFMKRWPLSESVVGAEGPTKGSHCALKVRPTKTRQTQEGAVLVHSVTFEPRLNNGPVVALHRLAEVTRGAAKLFEITPLIDDQAGRSFVKLADASEWAILGIPAPLGGYMPKDIQSGLTTLGKEALGLYGLFVFSAEKYAVRRLIAERLRNTPIDIEPGLLEKSIMNMAVQSRNSVLRVGRSSDVTLWEQVGVLTANSVLQALTAE